MATRKEFSKIQTQYQDHVFTMDLAVWHGDTEFERLCWLKTVHNKQLGEQGAFAALQKEAEIYKSIVHSQIPRLLAVINEENQFGLALEYQPAIDLEKIFQTCRKLKVKLSVAMACFVGQQIARVLQYLHEFQDPMNVAAPKQPIIHGNLNRENVWISLQGEVKLTEFCYVHRLRPGEKNLAGLIPKTQQRYHSPEFLHGGKADQRIDIYSLGMLMWELLSNVDLFAGENWDQIAKLKLDHSKTPSMLSRLNEHVDKELESIITRCMAYDPVSRFKSAREVDQEITAYLSKHHPDFTPFKLGSFLQFSHLKELQQTQKRIRDFLSQRQRQNERLEAVQAFADAELTSHFEKENGLLESEEALANKVVAADTQKYLVNKFGVDPYQVDAHLQFSANFRPPLKKESARENQAAEKSFFLKWILMSAGLFFIVVFVFGFYFNLKHQNTKSKIRSQKKIENKP